MTEKPRKRPARNEILLWFTIALRVGVGFALLFAFPFGVRW